MCKAIRIITLLATLAFGISCANARGIYQSETDFINEVFSGVPPAASRLWLKQDERQAASKIMQSKIPLRFKYWQKDQKTAWILEAIGKEKLITTGIIVKQNKIEKLKVLIFRESRGWEVRYPFFTKQFSAVALLKNQHQLNKNIDSISGATLSVRALKNLARLALFLDLTRQKNLEP